MNQTHEAHHTARPLHVGWLVAEGRRRLEEPAAEIVLSVVTGYAAYLPAERLGVSAVVAAVTAGLYVGWRPRAGVTRHAAAGLLVLGVLVYLLNAVLFLLVGLQLHPILSELTGSSVATSVGQAVLVSAVVIAVRVGWLVSVPYVIRSLDGRPSQVARRAGPRERLVAGWSGMRGAVSLATALALPPAAGDQHQPALPAAEPDHLRNLRRDPGHLVLQGLSLPWADPPPQSAARRQRGAGGAAQARARDGCGAGPAGGAGGR
jgi:CPA1 family monovalent cation:H+ antiporter